MLEVKHFAFKPIKVKYPIDWRADPYKNKNWVLHFMSLRWILKYPLTIQLEVFNDFYHFYHIKKVKNPYLDTLRGDHAAAIRIEILLALFGKIDDLSAKEKIKNALASEVKNALQEKMYRKGHNHGLMLDNSLLDIFFFDKNLFPNNLENIVIERGIETANKIYSLGGITNEHSVSYQEYNLPVILEFFNKLKKIKIDDFFDYSEKIKNTSLRVLGFFVRKNGQYFALGDTLRNIKPKIIEEVFGSPDAIINISKELNGLFCEEGFFAFKKRYNEKLLHFVATCQWKSCNHKQDDELSFCLEYDGKLIFDDLGYSGFLPPQQFDLLYSHLGHSTFFAENVDWSCRQEEPIGSLIEFYQATEAGFILEASHRRSFSFNKLSRKFELFEKCLKITDSFDFSEDVTVYRDKVGVHRFVLNPNITLDIKEKRVLLYDEAGIFLAYIEVLSCVEGKWTTTTLPYVGDDPRLISETTALDYKSLIGAESAEVEFIIVIVG